MKNSLKVKNVGVLKLDTAWRPVAWISAQKAVKYYQNNKILTDIGNTCAVFKGGINKLSQTESIFDIKPIIVVKGKLFDGKNFFRSPAITNELLFKRDNHTCAYCSRVFKFIDLSRDHIIPRHQKGRDIWSNVVTACKPCNHRKANKTPLQAGMELLIEPYTPNYIDVFMFKGNLLPEQKEFLQKMKK